MEFEIDPNYEFKAPRYHDFLATDLDQGSGDEWFEAHQETLETVMGESPAVKQLTQAWENMWLETPRGKKMASQHLKENTLLSASKNSGFFLINTTSEVGQETKNKNAADALTKGDHNKDSNKARPLTIPKEFHFSTENRIRRKHLLKTLKSPGITKKKIIRKAPGELTVPKPFQFHYTSKRRFREMAASEAKSPFVPLVQKLKNFEKELDRDKSSAMPTSSTQYFRKELTRPRSPALQTKIRMKPQFDVKTSEEREFENVQKMKPFKASKLNPKIISGDGPTGLAVVQKPQLTVPMSPAITKSKKPQPPPPSPPRIIKANPFHIPKPFQPKLEHRIIPPSKFTIPGEKIHAQKQKMFEEEVQRQLLECQRAKEFKAQPMPYLQSTEGLPPKRKIPITEPSPFNLYTEKRGEIHERNWKKEMEQKELEEQEQRTFKAQPLQLSDPFVPQGSQKPPTLPLGFNLFSEYRSEERKAFDEEIREKERLNRELKKQREEEDKRIQEEHIRELRKDITFQANPIRHYNGIKVKPSRRKLTVPMSPMIGNKRKPVSQQWFVQDIS